MIIQQHQVFRALASAVTAFLFSMAVFDKPPLSIEEVWQPLIQAALTFMSVLGFGAVVRSPVSPPAVAEPGDEVTTPPGDEDDGPIRGRLAP